MGSRQPGPATAEALRTEQARLTALYERLDAVRERTRAALAAAHAGGERGGTHQARFEREVSAAEHARRLAQLSGVEHGLCFGRTDDADGRTLYIGRTGLRDADGEIVLTDWRAPAARPFYTATPADPGQLVRRRHLHTRERTVVGLDDEVFDLDRLAEPDRRTLVGEAALMAALRRSRTGRMSQVVATIQAEQDRVIRSGPAGALVVEGGPGTGKTVAALHRAAYLLYTHREVLSRRGILVIGPTPLFSRYIGQVLPSLGETDVVVATVGELHPGVRAHADDPPAAAVVKGDLRMAAVVAAAVRDRQRLPDGDLEVSFPVRTSLRGGVEVAVEEMTISAPRTACAAARDRARRSGRPHNVARRLFVLDVLRALAADEAARLDAPADAEDLAYARKVLWNRPQVRAALDSLWPDLTPERLIGDLLSDPQALRRAAPELSADERGALLRPPGSPWTTGDVPLLDEAAELLGVDDSVSPAAERAAAETRRKEEAYARGVLEFTGLAEEETMEAAALAERHRSTGPHATTAERAAADRTWVYGHVIVDEAQELSAMAWRTVMRRIPARSLTIVGDLAQTGSAAGARSWGEVLDPYVAGRWRVERLQVNYRTPAEIMEVAADVLAAVAPDRRPPESVRAGGDRPRAVRAGLRELPDLVGRELEAIGAGRLAVIVPDARYAETAAALACTHAPGQDARPSLPAAGARARTCAEPGAPAAAPRPGAPAGPDALDRTVAVLTAAAAKGLEFDAVIVVEPAEILAGSPMGGHDLYVAVTRATRRLTVAHTGPLPPMLSRLARH
ncbi:ATP-binding domain-containing protein [Planomonospora sp. ID82291]|uniref:HelD family protein n=1 Tax=Planomonospora sp. ID82291 TaxID=2738136 RepID=UPI0018C405F2|nr:ATP-binding domain-containing protein [Planomonospora sp. ID82291]MBG0816558.1 ATP-binding domain-containing protein [Planomonospora sp. ID82291]